MLKVWETHHKPARIGDVTRSGSSQSLESNASAGKRQSKRKKRHLHTFGLEPRQQVCLNPIDLVGDSHEEAPSPVVTSTPASDGSWVSA